MVDQSEDFSDHLDASINGPESLSKDELLAMSEDELLKNAILSPTPNFLYNTLKGQLPLQENPSDSEHPAGSRYTSLSSPAPEAFDEETQKEIPDTEAETFEEADKEITATTSEEVEKPSLTESNANTALHHSDFGDEVDISDFTAWLMKKSRIRPDTSVSDQTDDAYSGTNGKKDLASEAEPSEKKKEKRKKEQKPKKDKRKKKDKAKNHPEKEEKKKEKAEKKKKKKGKEKKKGLKKKREAAALMLSGDIISETLAELLARQGHTAAAIAMYEKLCLIYPQKSSFFALKIEELSKNP